MLLMRFYKNVSYEILLDKLRTHQREDLSHSFQKEADVSQRDETQQRHKT